MADNRELYAQLFGLASGLGYQSIEQLTQAMTNASYTVGDFPNLQQTYPTISRFTNADQAVGYLNSSQLLKEVTQPNPLDSNVTNVTKYTVNYPINTNVDNNGKLVFSNQPQTGSFGQNAAYLAGSVSAAMAAASAGIFLGKTIDSALYNLNPDFWDANGMSSLNPETWSSITAGDTGLGANLFNLVFGINPDTQEVQAYMDDEALAYLAYWMAQQGVFDIRYTANLPSTMNEQYTIISGLSVSEAFNFCYPSWYQQYNNGFQRFDCSISDCYNLVVNKLISLGKDPDNYVCNVYQDQLFLYTTIIEKNSVWERRPYSQPTVTDPHYELGYYRTSDSANHGYACTIYTTATPTLYQNAFNAINNFRSPIGGVIASGSFFYIDPFRNNTGYGIWSAGATIGSGVDGIGDQENADLPDTSTWESIPSTLVALEQQYPDAFANSITYQGFDKDGNPIPRRKVPVPLPEPDRLPDYSDVEWPWEKPWSATKPQSQTDVSSQAQPAYKYAHAYETESAAQAIAETIGQTVTQEKDTPTYNPEQEPNTGDGSTPVPVPSSGSASALWSVYHPTQAQVDQFGAWLWTEDIVTQIRQLLQNPMEGIITLHKVFAPPVDSGSGTIVVGRLDSQVPSATVNQQYVYVDCGTVDVLEYFGNVFDYEPHTSISLYLPFIGIVPLNTSDVMRGSVNVTYGVDIFTGACLATVTVTRDGETAALYQYSGVASVEYPLTGAQHTGLVSGWLGVAGGIASAVGGNPMGALTAVGSAFSIGKVHNARASGFSGNAGAMGIKIPYLIISRPQTKVAGTFPQLQGYPTNTSVKLGACSGQVRVRAVHVEGINATETELGEIENLLLSGVLI